MRIIISGLVVVITSLISSSCASLQYYVQKNLCEPTNDFSAISINPMIPKEPGQNPAIMFISQRSVWFWPNFQDYVTRNWTFIPVGSQAGDRFVAMARTFPIDETECQNPKPFTDFLVIYSDSTTGSHVYNIFDPIQAKWTATGTNDTWPKLDDLYVFEGIDFSAPVTHAFTWNDTVYVFQGPKYYSIELNASPICTALAVTNKIEHKMDSEWDQLADKLHSSFVDEAGTLYLFVEPKNTAQLLYSYYVDPNVTVAQDKKLTINKSLPLGGATQPLLDSRTPTTSFFMCADLPIDITTKPTPGPMNTIPPDSDTRSGPTDDDNDGTPIPPNGHPDVKPEDKGSTGEPNSSSTKKPSNSNFSTILIIILIASMIIALIICIICCLFAKSKTSKSEKEDQEVGRGESVVKTEEIKRVEVKEEEPKKVDVLVTKVEEIKEVKTEVVPKPSKEKSPQKEVQSEPKAPTTIDFIPIDTKPEPVEKESTAPTPAPVQKESTAPIPVPVPVQKDSSAPIPAPLPVDLSKKTKSLESLSSEETTPPDEGKPNNPFEGMDDQSESL